jgi:hypothetical protein
MPYEVKKIGGKFQLFNINKKKLIMVTFKTKESAINQGKNWMKFRKEKPIVKGNKILNQKKIKDKNK